MADEVQFDGKWCDMVCVPRDVVSALSCAGFESTTPVQKAVVPNLLSNKDVIVEAVTGSGKTLAFLVPLIVMIHRNPSYHGRFKVFSVILLPTHELAKQVYGVLEGLSDNTGISAYCTIGSDAFDKNITDMKGMCGVNVVVGTPGRVLRLMEEAAFLSFEEVELLILDEADQLLEFGLQKLIYKIAGKLPKQRRTALFSATLSDDFSLIKNIGLRNPIKIMVQVESKFTHEIQRVPETLCVFYIVVEPEEKLSHLIEFLKSKKDQKNIIYFSTCLCVDYFFRVITRQSDLKDILFTVLHKKLPGPARVEAFSSFVASPKGTLLCTDLASRGLDIKRVDWVVQFDPPKDPKSFIHRSGRSARFGLDGSVLFYIYPKEKAFLEYLSLKKVPFAKFDDDGVRINVEMVEKIQKECKMTNYNQEDLGTLSSRAFSSYLRFYKEHQIKYIFNLKNLNISSVVNLFGIVKIPNMKELGGFKKTFIPFIPKL